MTSAFRRPPLPFGDSTPAETPYQRAGQVWDERIGSARAQAGNWRLACFFSMGVSALALFGYISERSDTHVATYVVPIDEAGRPGTITLASRVYQPTKAEIGYFLSDWIGWVRGRSPVDPIVNNQNILKGYSFVDGEGRGELDNYEKTVADAEKTGSSAGEAITVQVKSVIQRTPTTYQVAWSETVFKAGEGAATTQWTGLFGITINPPRDEAALRRNPLGLFITSIQISQELNP